MTTIPEESAKRLRQLAEQKARLDEEAALKTLSIDDARLMFHELRVYQIELEMQNEELRRTQHELEVSRARYFDLYNLAPIGYLTLSEQGLILEVNLAAAGMLGVERIKILKKPISRFIYHADQDIYYLHRKKLFKANELQAWEMRLVRYDGSPFWARLQAAPAENKEYWVTLVDITERKLVEDSLKASEEKFKTVIMAAKGGIILQEQGGKITVWNHMAERIFGVSADEACRETSTSHDWRIYGEDGKPIPGNEHPSMLTLASGEPCLNRDIKVERDNGDYSWINVNTSPIFTGGGLLPDSVVITFSDVTERRQGRMVLEARLRISDYAFTHSLDELLTMVLDEAEAITDSRIGFFHFVDDDQVTLSLQAWSSNTLSSVCSDAGVCRHYPLDSAGVWADAVRERKPLIHNDYASLSNRTGLPPGHAPVERELVVPILRNNLIVAVLGVGNKKYDYTAQDVETVQHLANLAWEIISDKRAEEALRVSREQFKAYVDNSFDVIFVLDREGQFLFVSRAWERHFGYSFKNLLGKKFDFVVHPDDVEPCNEYIAQVSRDSRGKTSPEYRVKRADGSWRWFVANISKYLDVNQEWQLIGVAHDVTERKNTERELQQAKEAAEAANRAKSDFLSTMSHEIRTPLGAMLGNVELLEGTPLTPPQQECLRDCKSAAQILLNVINDVLDFSKIEAGKLVLSNEIFSVASLARQLARMYSAVAVQKGLDLTLSLADDLPEYIDGDQQRLRQIIANLLSNAIKFTEHGTVSLEIVREQVRTGASSKECILRIVVKDTGIGISPDKQGHVFESFTQIENFTTRKVAGTGLGLPICRRLLALMGGSITVSSMPDKGSTFTVVLPVTLAQAHAQVSAKIHPRQGLVPPRKILLADDDDRGRAVAQKLLQRRGYEVTAVGNGAELLDELQKGAFEIVLTDISMPDMEGTEVARIIRSGERGGIDPHIPIVAMTAHAFSDDRDRFIAAGINGYIAKPVNLEELFRQIEELCHESSEAGHGTGGVGGDTGRGQ
ncbi:MAG: PAS domain S-box protein [Desulfuromonadaceae bacterium]|nr:PAS domain S-box protein [Desulfuromonadaceae bacterium]MDD2848987.1 PAS domain S-box protein [Desulfuromonadaceae bacterium]MDD4130336.1 PAS domain S-box protein [Desulfuromonadaceae bacterium]